MWGLWSGLEVRLNLLEPKSLFGILAALISCCCLGAIHNRRIRSQGRFFVWFWGDIPLKELDPVDKKLLVAGGFFFVIAILLFALV